MENISQLIDTYHSFMREQTVLHTDQHSGWTEISTPFLGAFNDAIVLYAKQHGTGVIISDDGQTLRDLELEGVRLSSSVKRRELLQRILDNFGVIQENGELLVRADAAQFAAKKFNLLSAVMEVQSLHTLNRSTTTSIFLEEVRRYLEEQQPSVTPHFILRGRTGLEYTFDFQIMQRQKEVVVKAFHTANKLTVPSFLYACHDIRSVREEQTKKPLLSLAIINDEREVQAPFLEAMEKEDVRYVLWSQRHRPINLDVIRPVSAA